MEKLGNTAVLEVGKLTFVYLYEVSVEPVLHTVDVFFVVFERSDELFIIIAREKSPHILKIVERKIAHCKSGI